MGRCFDLSGAQAIREVISQCEQLNTTTENCTQTCSEAIASAKESLGCCLHALLTGSDHLDSEQKEERSKATGYYPLESGTDSPSKLSLNLLQDLNLNNRRCSTAAESQNIAC